jgi:hypothetical protein
MKTRPLIFVVLAILFFGLIDRQHQEQKVTLTINNKSYDLYFWRTSTSDILQIFGPAKVDTELVAVPKEITTKETYTKDETISYPEKGIMFRLAMNEDKPYADAKKDQAYLFEVEIDSNFVCLDGFCVGESKNTVTRQLGPCEIPSWAKDSTAFYCRNKEVLIFDAVKEADGYKIKKITKFSSKKR